ncbi:MAG: hypothetical protein II265_07370 [Clostridia bacterium]|nr:hypothetical protein [Clostridia bacterium]
MRRTIKEKKPKPLFISTPRGDKSHFDDFWKIKRSELEALKKKPIKIGLSDVCSSLGDIFKPAIKPMSKRIATEYERKLLGLAALHRVIRVYVLTENKMEVKDGKYVYSVVNKFYVRRPKGKECVCHDFTKLVTMSEREFESLPHTENYEIAKMYREAMRSTPSVEKLLRQRRKQNEISTKRN